MDKGLEHESRICAVSQRRLTNKTALNLTAQKIIRKSKYQTLHSTGRLASKFATDLSPIENI